MAARKTLSPKLVKAICELIREGNFPQTAASVCGVTKSQHDSWVKIGRARTAEIQAAENDGLAPPQLTRHQRLCIAYVDAVEAAEAALESELVAAYRAHAKVTPDSAAGIPKFLASRFRSWREDKSVKVGGSGEPISLVVQTVEAVKKNDGE
jgi:hypothetical protein